MFPDKTKIFLLDNYTCHVTTEVKREVERKGWFLIYIGGGITGDCQGNDVKGKM